jgi:hypothetical protein
MRRLVSGLLFGSSLSAAVVLTQTEGRIRIETDGNSLHRRYRIVVHPEMKPGELEELYMASSPTPVNKTACQANFGSITTSVAGTGSSGSDAFFHAFSPPRITADGIPRSASVRATCTAVASRRQVQ